ncbi:unnamed protein product [Cuscuta campestris]|uniref:ENT domain-containing protein n=1 Tax=Cuscuta campestris TaxID=132261 RepID=A0A484LHI1_9ASTE|nr:unnamed protein product [Cuscuta campestris]
MEYGAYDSSGTDDDLPPTHQNRIPRGGRVAGNGRSSAVMAPMPYPKGYGETDMEAQIHQLEQEAYSSVLRAFKAQADAITWEKESLITELRKELRLSNEEHRELLGRVNSDDVIRRIREWRQSGVNQQGIMSTVQPVHDPVPSPSVSAPRKKQKIPPSLPPQSFGGPSPSFHPQTMITQNQPPSLAPAAPQRGPLMGPKGKKHKSMPPGMKMQFPPSGRGQFSNRISQPADGVSNESMIGRKLRTRWPDDNNFYEAVITDYDPTLGRHRLLYDMETESETWEWVKLSEISPDDIQWDDGPGLIINRTMGRDSAPGVGRGRGMTKPQSRKEFPPSQNGIGKKVLGDIQLLHTDTLIKEVERVFSASNPNPLEVEKAKKVLKEHEQALIDAISRLGDISEGEHADERGHFMHGQE